MSIEIKIIILLLLMYQLIIIFYYFLLIKFVYFCFFAVRTSLSLQLEDHCTTAKCLYSCEATCCHL